MQSTFDFYPDTPWRPERPERLFFGIYPDVETSIRIERFRDRFICDYGLGGTPVGRERLHVSLHHVGDYGRLRSMVLHGARQAGGAVLLPSFNMEFRFIKSFGGAVLDGDTRRPPLVLLGEAKAAAELHKTLGAALALNGFRPKRHFLPHMTLFYGARSIPMQAIEPVRFVVTEFALIHSELGLTRHNVIDRWSLDCGAAAAISA